MEQGRAPVTVSVSAAERRDGTLHPEKLAAALAALRRDGLSPPTPTPDSRSPRSLSSEG